jgi:hypothetical protein
LPRPEIAPNDSALKDCHDVSVAYGAHISHSGVQPCFSPEI